MAKNVAKNGLSSFVFEGFSKIKFGLRQPFLVRKTFINGLKVRYNFNFISSHFLILLLLHGARRVTRSPVLQPERSFCATQIEMIYSDIFCTNFFSCLQLTVQDSKRASGSLSNSAQLIINVEDVNDENPQFDTLSPGGVRCLLEGDPGDWGADANDLCSLSILDLELGATDQDETAALTMDIFWNGTIARYVHIIIKGT